MRSMPSAMARSPTAKLIRTVEHGHDLERRRLSTLGCPPHNAFQPPLCNLGG